LNQIYATDLPQNGGAFASHILLAEGECPLPPPLFTTASVTPANRLPSNDTTTSLVLGLVAAHEEYGPPKSGQACRTGILFIVQPRNMNICDERPLEYALWNHKPPIPAYRILFGEEVLACTSLTQSRELLYRSTSGSPPIEVSVAYLRAGYDPNEYTLTGYRCRLLLERSRAIKCPSILGHLATFKRVQQALAAPGALARFLSHTEAERVAKTFAPMYPLDESSEASRRGRTLACNPQTAINHVLKPPLEGGGHNVYRGEIPEFLDSVPTSRWHTYILMELINPIIQKNILLSSRGIYTAANADSPALHPSSERQDPHTTAPADQLPGPTVSELGIFGVCLWKSQPEGHHPQLLRNNEAGWSLKTKPEAVNEMSVVKGYGCFDCPYLVDEETYLANSKYVT
jgi:glutathione synthase